MKKQNIRMAVAAGTVLSASLITVDQALAADPWSFSANIGAVSNYIWRGVTQTGDQAAVQGGIDVAHESGFYAGTWISNVDWDEGSSEEVTGIVPVDPDTGLPMTDENGNYVVQGYTSGSDSSSPNYELDLYTGFGGNITDDLSWDINTIYYAYPDGRDANFWEVGGSGTYKWFTLGLAYTIAGDNDGGPFDDGDWYFFGGAEFDLPYDFGFSVRGGYYDFRHDEEPVEYIAADGSLYTKNQSWDYWNWGASITREAGNFGTFSLNYDQNDGESDLGYNNDPKFWVGWNKEF